MLLKLLPLIGCLVGVIDGYCTGIGANPSFLGPPKVEQVCVGTNFIMLIICRNIYDLVQIKYSRAFEMLVDILEGLICR